MILSAANVNQPALNRVAVISPGLLPVPPVMGGSVETVIQKMAEVSSGKYSIDIYGPAYRGMPPEQTAGNRSYYRFPTSDYSGYFKTVREQIGKKNYDIIQVENRPLFVPRTKAANPRSKFICSLHSMIHTEPRLIRPGLTEKIFSQCERVLVYSKFMRDRFAAMFPRVADRFCYIHLATEPDRFKPGWDFKTEQQVKKIKAKYGIPEGRKVILFAGRFIPKKGVHIVVDAMHRIRKQYPDCCLVVVGSGWFGSRRPSPYINEVREKSLPIADHIYFTNYLEQEQLPLFFAMADVFICPSQWDEPFGLVNVEAMSCGVPVVASARGGIPEIVTDGVNGFLVRNESEPASFAGPVLKLLRDPDLARSMAINGRKAVETYFNWDRAGQDLINLYDEILSETLS